jgi:eukaryotic-like serine/threonine-protein kinase
LGELGFGPDRMSVLNDKKAPPRVPLPRPRGKDTGSSGPVSPQPSDPNLGAPPHESGPLPQRLNTGTIARKESQPVLPMPPGRDVSASMDWDDDWQPTQAREAPAVTTGPNAPVAATTAPPQNLSQRGPTPAANLPSTVQKISVPNVPRVEMKPLGPDVTGPTKPLSADGSAPVPAVGSRPQLASLGDDDLEQSLDESAEPDQYVGTTLGDRYIIDKVLGEGGMGKVYRARHKVIEKKVAVKILHAELAKDKEAVGRFLREARSASSIGNPHIVDIMDFGEAPDGSTYFVMEYLNGESLGDMLERDKKLPIVTVMNFAQQLCEGLQAAHEQGIVHRDLKPDNIILVKPSGTFAGQTQFCKILDFGIAKVSGQKEGKEKLTMAGAVFGTPHYMSPEQAAGEAVDARTDVYSLGVMMYEMASGEMPFNADNFMGILTQHMYKAPPPLRSQPGAAEVPQPFEAVVMKCLAKKREQRYQSMLELAEDIRKLQKTGNSKAGQEQELNRLAEQMNAPAPSLDAEALMRPKRRTWLWLTMLAVVGATAGAVAVNKATKAPAGDTAAASADPAASAAPSQTTAAVASPAASGRGVLIYSEPATAFAIVGDKRINLPDTIVVPEGGKVTVRVEAGAGYETKTVELDDATPDKLKVELKRRTGAGLDTSARPGTKVSPLIAPPASAGSSKTLPPPPTKGTPKKGKGGPDGVVDPW